MGLKVGDKIRVKTLAEMLAIHNENFFGRKFFEKWGNHKFIIIDIDSRSIINMDDRALGKAFKINVNDEWGSYYIFPNAFEKINSFDMGLDENLFKL